MTTKKQILVLMGDGIGQDVVPQALRVVKAIEHTFNHQFMLDYADIGGTAFDHYGCHFPEDTRRLCETAQAILFGSVGGPIEEAHLPKWHNCEKNSILALRKTLQLNQNLRPISIYPELQEISPLKSSLIKDQINLLIVRELVGDIYFGEHQRFIKNNQRYATDVAEYNEQQITAIAHSSFQWARKRKQKLTSVDKANVLETSKLWREIVMEVAVEYPDIQCEHMLIDNCAMQLIINPKQFDVILTSNLFGDILSDAAAALPGSLGLIPSASLSAHGVGLYEPAGGSAPHIAGKNIANPIAQILSLAMLLQYSFNLPSEAHSIEQAIASTLDAGLRTQDIFTNGKTLVGTQEFTNHVIQCIGS